MTANTPAKTDQESAAEDKISFADTLESLTGFEEDLISDRFKQGIGALYDNVSISKAYRAILFILNRRSGDPDAKAYKKAMDLTVGQVSDRFVPDEDDADDVDPENPDTDQGKGGSGSD